MNDQPTYNELLEESLFYYGQVPPTPEEEWQESLDEWDRLSEQASVLWPSAPCDY